MKRFMKPSFKYIIIGLLSCLSFVFLWQLYWLKGLYQSIEEETRMDIIACMEKADLEEMQLRIDSLSRVPEKLKKHQSMSISKALSADENSFNKQKKISKVEQFSGSDTIIIKHDVEEQATDLRTLNLLIKEVVLSVHHVLDTIAPVNLNHLDSLIKVQFKNKGIQARYYYSEWIDLRSDSTLKRSDGYVEAPGRKKSFEYVYDQQNELAYRIYTEPLFKAVAIQMSGILTTTLLILIILSLSFWYLIQTVLKQKTLEQMKDDFTNNMTHELKTPIAVAYSAIDALLNFNLGNDPEKRTRYLKIAQDQLTKLTELVEQILSTSMEQHNSLTINKEVVQIKDMVHPLIEQYQLKSKKEVIFHVQIEPENLQVKVDKVHFSNILSNLIDNAIKYSGDELIINIEAFSKDNFCEIQITDNGMGIPPEKKNFIFDKFYRVSEGNHHNVKGYGLGLYYVKTMVEKHGGTIHVESTVEKGSCFTIKIPVE